SRIRDNLAQQFVVSDAPHHLSIFHYRNLRHAFVVHQSDGILDLILLTNYYQLVGTVSCLDDILGCSKSLIFKKAMVSHPLIIINLTHIPRAMIRQKNDYLIAFFEVFPGIFQGPMNCVSWWHTHTHRL